MVQPASDETRQRLNLTLAFSGSHFSPAASERERARLTALGLTLREGTPSERDLAWIDAEFGGYWSSEARAGYTLVALDGDAPAGFITVDQRRIRWCWTPPNGAGLLGPLGVATAHRGRGIGASLARLGLGVLRSRGYSRATFAAVLGDAMRQWYATVASLPLEVKPARYARRRHRATVLASGGGTNFQAVIDAARSGDVDVDPTALVVNRPGAFVLERAARAGVHASIVQWDRAAETRAAYDARVLAAVEASQPDLVLLLGWMHVLPPEFVASFPHILNIHPGYLPFDADAETVVVPDGSAIPAFRGAHPIRDALAAGVQWYGATVHRVGNDVDRGEVLARRPLALREKDVDEALAALRPTEHGVLLSAVRRWTYQGS